MALVAQAKAAGEQFMFKTIDGQGKLASALKSVMDSICFGLYQAGALYGGTPNEAYYVDTGSAINTPTSISEGKLRASAQVVLSLHAKAVEIELVTIPIGSGSPGGATAGTLAVTPAATPEPADEE